MRPIRVLHILWSLDTGGIEVWLRNMLRAVDPREVSFDFLVFERAVDAGLEQEIRAVGARVFLVSPEGNPRFFGPRLAMAIRRRGPYDVAHCHVVAWHYPLVWAALAGVRTRLLHLHRESSGWPHPPLLAGWALNAMRTGHEGQAATRVLAVSRAVARSWYPSCPDDENPCELAYCGVAVDGFDGKFDRRALRASLGLKPGHWVIANVGRLVEVKNHRFLIDVFSVVRRKRSDARLLLIGDGPLRATLQAQVNRLGLAGRVIFAGTRRDVPALLRAADYFAFPSRSEGFALSVLEAQAAGLRMTLSAGLTREVEVAPDLIQRRAVEAAPESWARGILSHAGRAVEGPASALERVRRSPFTIEKSVDRMFRIYHGAVPRR